MGLKDDVFGTSFRPQGQEPQTRTEHFFHGTGHDLSGETHLKPSAWTGHENYDYDVFNDAHQRRNSVFMADRESAAWNWASPSSGRRTVHTVVPEGRVTRDTVDEAQMAPGARITGRIDIPPYRAAQSDIHNARVNTDRSVQGTLPPVNWKQFHDPGAEVVGAQRRRSVMVEERREAVRQSAGPGEAHGSLF